jgi:hypothetical protein
MRNSGTAPNAAQPQMRLSNFPFSDGAHHNYLSVALCLSPVPNEEWSRPTDRHPPDHITGGQVATIRHAANASRREAEATEPGSSRAGGHSLWAKRCARPELPSRPDRMQPLFQLEFSAASWNRLSNARPLC